jgi:tetratricopeptide (TPR) repeat protein
MYSDQERFDFIYANYKRTARLNGDNDPNSKVAILPPDALNSDPPAMTKQKPYNQILHLMGEGMALRKRSFRTAWENVCNHMESNHSIPLKAQLGLTRKKLLQWTLEEYGREVSRLLQEYNEVSKSGGLDGAQTRKLNHVVGRFAHALEHAGGSDSDFAIATAYLRRTGNATTTVSREVVLQDARALRSEAFELLWTNIEARATRIAKASMPTDWPEQMKVVVESGLQANPTGDFDTRETRAERVDALLTRIMSKVAPAQRAAVQHMQAEAASQRGVLEADRGRIAQALTHFLRQLRIVDTLAQEAGEHLLVAPLTQCAVALSMLGRFEEAAQHFARALRIAEAQLGPYHFR